MDSDANHRMFYTDDLVYATSSASTESGDVLCYAPCFGWFVIRFVGDRATFLLLGKAIPSYPTIYTSIIRDKDLGEVTSPLHMYTTC